MVSKVLYPNSWVWEQAAVLLLSSARLLEAAAPQSNDSCGDIKLKAPQDVARHSTQPKINLTVTKELWDSPFSVYHTLASLVKQKKCDYIRRLRVFFPT